MAISHKTILQKMKNELLLAIEKEKTNPKQMVQQIAKVHLLCELLLEESELVQHGEMMPSKIPSQKNDANKEITIQQSPSEHNGANGDSIFDF